MERAFKHNVMLLLLFTSQHAQNEMWLSALISVERLQEMEASWQRPFLQRPAAMRNALYYIRQMI